MIPAPQSDGAPHRLSAATVLLVTGYMILVKQSYVACGCLCQGQVG
jgi:hypothetical protein